VFIKKLDPASKAIPFLVLSALAMLVQVVLYFVMAGASSSGGVAALSVMLMLSNLVIVVLFILAVFGMRKSLLHHYNTVEPIGLKLGGAMTFFFSIFYFQYHFARIANLKGTGA
jgi:hypothetical protein